MDLKKKIQSVINVFETGTPEGDYSNVSVYADGRFPNGKSGMRQVTYGRSQTTEQSHLQTLMTNYCLAGGQYANDLKNYIDKVSTVQKGGTLLSKDSTFKNLLIKAGLDPIMQKCQDDLFDTMYYEPAMKWANENGFNLPLSMLVIYDSFIHSGKIRDDLRNKFKEVPPIKGGDEKKWITDYVYARHVWLKYHRLKVLHFTVYRTLCFMNCIKDENWLLNKPVNTNGIII